MTSDPIPAAAPPARPEDVALMRRIADGDAGAFAAFYDRHSPLVFAFCLRGLRDRGDAEDLTVEIFQEIWDRCSRYEQSRGSPVTYLLRITRSRIVDRLRARRSRGLAQDVVADDPSVDESATPLGNMLLKEECERVRSAMRTLSPAQRTALELAFYGALTHSEIARRLNEPLGTIKTRIRQALARLRESLPGGD